jgi:hypothetical protein
MKLDGLRPEQVTPYPVTHDLQLSPADLRSVAGRHTGLVEQHRADLPLLLPSGRRKALTVPAAETVGSLEDSGAWITLFGVQNDPLLRETAAHLGRLLGPDVGLVLSLVCSSSRGVTPAHMDVHDVLLLQLRGHKRFGTGAFSRRSEADAELRRRFGPGRENLRRLPDQQQEWDLEPGTGVVVPAYTPHWAHVGDEVSVALSVAMSTPALRRREALHRTDAVLRERHVRLPAPGRSKVADEARLALHTLGRRLR